MTSHWPFPLLFAFPVLSKTVWSETGEEKDMKAKRKATHLLHRRVNFLKCSPLSVPPPWLPSTYSQFIVHGGPSVSPDLVKNNLSWVVLLSLPLNFLLPRLFTPCKSPWGDWSLQLTGVHLIWPFKALKELTEVKHISQVNHILNGFLDFLTTGMTPMVETWEQVGNEGDGMRGSYPRARGNLSGIFISLHEPISRNVSDFIAKAMRAFADKSILWQQ